MSKHTFIRLHTEPNDDEELVCLFCDGPRCEQRSIVSGGGKSKFLGVHNSCLDKHMAKLTNTNTSE